jgi:hypothetical protein
MTLISVTPCIEAVEPRTSIHDDDDALEFEECTEEIESLGDDDFGARIKSKQRSRRKNDPGHRWEQGQEQQQLMQHQYRDDLDIPGSPSNTKENDHKCTKRSKLKRSSSVDGSGRMYDGTIGKRHTWDVSSPVKGKPDFRWDKLDFDKLCDGEQQQPPSTCHNKSPISSPGKIRRKPPRRCKSDIGGLDEDSRRPLLSRTSSRVRFCLADNVCIEVPRTPKEQKTNLFYSKREIKVFKAEKKEEKKEQRRGEKEREKAEQKTILDRIKAQASKTTFAPAGTPAIASAC